MPAYRVTAHDGAREYACRVQADDPNDAMRLHRAATGHTVLNAVQEAARAPKGDQPASQMTRRELRDTIAWGVFWGLLTYGMLGVLAVIVIAVMLGDR